MKVCTACRLEKPTADFALNKKYRDGLSNYCRPCVSSKNKAWRNKQDHASLRRRDAARWALRRAKQEADTGPVPRGCEICGAAFVAGCQATAPHWDHHHGTGHGRGWLCLVCNAGLGSFGDNPVVLARAIKYLKDKGSFATRPVIS